MTSQFTPTMAPITRSLTTRQLRSRNVGGWDPVRVYKPSTRKAIITKVAPQVIHSNLQELKQSIMNVKIHHAVEDDEEDPLFHSIIQYEIKRRKLSVTYAQVMEVEALRRRVRQKLGHFWQEFLSHAKGYENLYSGHASGCDLINHKRKLIVELKNKHSTMNASSYHGVNMKMLAYLAKHPGYTGVIGFINDRTPEGRDVINRYGIRELGGKQLMAFLFQGERYVPAIEDLMQVYNRI